MKFTPHPYQREALAHLYAEPRAALWAPMGGGKTVVTLTALEDLTLVEDVYPALVLAPLRVARTVWGPETQKWAHLRHLRVSVVTGNPAQRAAALAAPADIYAMNYDNLPWLLEHVGKDRWPFKTVVADEFTRLKSFRLRQGSKRARALSSVAHGPVRRFIGLTGTPSPNGLKDLWGQTWFLDKGARLGSTFSAFADRWFRKGYDGFSLQPVAEAEAEIIPRLKDLCLTVVGLQVDEPITNRIYVDLPSKARRVYDEMEEEMFAQIESEGVTAANAAVRTSKCLQIANGAIYTDEDHNWSEVHDAKLDALDSVIEEANGAPILVAYNFKTDLIRLLKRFPNARALDADPATIRQWNAGDIPILLAHPASAGHGLNLQDGGNVIVFFGLNWNLEEHMQIIERIGPLRQKQSGHERPVFVHYIMASATVDDMVLDRLTSKRSTQDVLIEAMKRRKSAHGG